MIEYPNIAPALGAVISSRLATMAELSTVLGTEDVYSLLEIMTIDAHNQRVIRAHNANRN